MTTPFDARMAQVVHEAVVRGKSQPSQRGTVTSVAANRLSAFVTFDPATIAVPVMVAGGVDVQEGDRVTLDYYGPVNQGHWVVTNITSRRPGSLLFVEATGGGTGTGPTEIKDASGDLVLNAIDGEVLNFRYKASGIAAAAGHAMIVRLRDSGSAASPTNTSTILDETHIELAGNTNIRNLVVIDFAIKVGTGTYELTPGAHTVAIFYVRHASGGVTTNVQLENAGGSGRRRLWVCRVVSPLALAA